MYAVKATPCTAERRVQTSCIAAGEWSHWQARTDVQHAGGNLPRPMIDLVVQNAVCMHVSRFGHGLASYHAEPDVTRRRRNDKSNNAGQSLGGPPYGMHLKSWLKARILPLRLCCCHHGTSTTGSLTHLQQV